MLKLIPNHQKLKIDRSPRKQVKNSTSKSLLKKNSPSQLNKKNIQPSQSQNNPNIKLVQRIQLVNKKGGLSYRPKTNSVDSQNKKFIQSCFNSETQVKNIFQKLLKKKIITIFHQDVDKYLIEKKSLLKILQQILTYKNKKSQIAKPFNKSRGSINSKSSARRDSFQLVHNTQHSCPSRKLVFSTQHAKTNKQQLLSTKKHDFIMPKLDGKKRRLSTFCKQTQFKGLNNQDKKTEQMKKTTDNVLFKKMALEKKISDRNQSQIRNQLMKIKLIDENFQILKNKQLAQSLCRSMQALNELMSKIQRQYYQQSEEIIAIFNKIVRNLVSLIKIQRKQVDVQEDILNKYMAKLYDLKGHFVAYWSEIKKKAEVMSQIMKNQDSKDYISAQQRVKNDLILKQISQIDKISTRYSQYLPV